MTEAILRHSRIYALQNGLAAALFGLLFGAEILRHLLDSFPGTEILWRLTSFANLTVAPGLDLVGSTVTSPVALLGVLALAVALPIAAWRRRNWLGTAVSGHCALALMVLLAFCALKRHNSNVALASLSDVLDIRFYDTSAASFILLAAVMGVFCILNHVAFFHARKA